MLGGNHLEAGYDVLPHAPATAAAYQTALQHDYGADATAIAAQYPLTKYPSPGLALSNVETDSAPSPVISVCSDVSSWRLARATSGYRPYAYEFNDPSARWTLAVFGTNLANRAYYVGGVNYASNVGAAHYDLGSPREFGVSLRMGRILKQAGQSNPFATLPILEVNPKHPLVERLRTAADEAPLGEHLSRTAAQGRARASAARREPRARPVAKRYFVAELISLNTVLI